MQSGPHRVVAGWLIRLTGNVLFFQVSTVSKYSFQGLQFYCHEVHFLHVVQFTKLQINKAPIEKSVKVHTKNRTWREKFSYVTFLRSWIQNRPAVFPFNLQSRQKRTQFPEKPKPFCLFLWILQKFFICWHPGYADMEVNLFGLLIFPLYCQLIFFIDLPPCNV